MPCLATRTAYGDARAAPCPPGSLQQYGCEALSHDAVPVRPDRRGRKWDSGMTNLHNCSCQVELVQSVPLCEAPLELACLLQAPHDQDSWA